MRIQIGYRIAVAMAVGLCGVTGSAQAAKYDKKIMSGTVCVPYVSAANSGYFVLPNGIQNAVGSEDKWVLCPLVRDADAPGSDFDFDVGVQVAGNRLLPGSVACILRSHGNHGEEIDTHAYATAVASGHWSIGLSTSDLNSPAPINLICRLPPKASLSSIQLVEAVPDP